MTMLLNPFRYAAGSTEPAFVGAATYTHGNVGDGWKTISLPSGVQAGDVVMSVSTTDRGKFTAASSGFSRIDVWSMGWGDPVNNDTSSAFQYALWSKTLTAADSSYQLYWSLTDSHAETGAVVCSLVFRNLSYVSDDTNGTMTNPTDPSFDNGAAIHIWSLAQNGNFNGWPVGISAQSWISGGAAEQMVGITFPTTAGTEGGYTVGTNSWNGRYKQSSVVILQP